MSKLSEEEDFTAATDGNSKIAKLSKLSNSGISDAVIRSLMHPNFFYLYLKKRNDNFRWPNFFPLPFSASNFLQNRVW